MRRRYLLIFLGGVLAHSQILTLPQVSYKRCVNGLEHGACFELGYLYQNTSKPGDLALGNQYVRYGCKLQRNRSCTLAEANQQSLKYLKAKRDWDEVKRKALIDMQTIKTKDELACEKGDGKSCQQAGTHYFYLAKPLNPEKGKAMFEEGCRLGDRSSCRSADLIKNGTVRVFEVEM